MRANSVDKTIVGWLSSHVPLISSVCGVVVFCYSTFATIQHVEDKFHSVMTRLEDTRQTQQQILHRLDQIRDMIKDDGK